MNYTNAFLVNTIHAQNGGIGWFFQKFTIPPEALELLRLFFWGFVAISALFFAVQAVFQAINYFRSENEREKTEAKNKAIDKLIGMVVCLVAGALVAMLLRMVGITVITF